LQTASRPKSRLRSGKVYALPERSRDFGRDAAAALDALTAPRAERSDAARCSEQTWPQIERACQVPVGGAELRQRVRLVTPERRSTPDPVISRPARTELASR